MDPTKNKIEDYMWSYALAFTVFDLDLPSAQRLISCEDHLISFVAKSYSEQRKKGLYLRSASAVNSDAWTSCILQAISSKEKESGRSSFARFTPNQDKTKLFLDNEVLHNLFQLAYVLREASYHSVFNAVNFGSFYQPDGALDKLFGFLDFEFGSTQVYYRVMGLFELAHRFEQLRFGNKVQAYTATRSVQRCLNENRSLPRLVVAADWALKPLSDIAERSQKADTDAPEVILSLSPKEKG